MIMAKTVRTTAIHGNLVVGDMTVTPQGVLFGDTIQPVTDEQLKDLRAAALQARIPLLESDEDPEASASPENKTDAPASVDGGTTPEQAADSTEPAAPVSGRKTRS